MHAAGGKQCLACGQTSAWRTYVVRSAHIEDVCSEQATILSTCNVTSDHMMSMRPPCSHLIYRSPWNKSHGVFEFLKWSWALVQGHRVMYNVWGSWKPFLNCTGRRDIVVQRRKVRTHRAGVLRMYVCCSVHWQDICRFHFIIGAAGRFCWCSYCREWPQFCT